MISYAQAREDVLLHRVLHHVHHSTGFYIDVGAYHPTNDSVTKHFYDCGWRGVNVEPSRDLFPAFLAERERDVNLQLAVTDTAGEVTFHRVEGQLGTLESRIAETHINAGLSNESYTVAAATLTQICEQYAPHDIHFLTIDVEGHETGVLRGMDFKRFRPWVLIVEATEPNRLDLLTHHHWEDFVITAGYTFALSDLPNRYYVANEHSELLPKFVVPADNYRYARDQQAIESLEHRLQDALVRLRGDDASVMAGQTARALLRFLKPYKAIGRDMVRIGRPFDGGYVMVDAFKGVEVAYSLGINGDISWDFDIAQRDINVYQYDHTINKLPLEHSNFHWSKIGITHRSEGNLKSLNDIIAENGHLSEKNMLLKCDIEDHEWLTFAFTPTSIFEQFSQIVVEFHHLRRFGDPSFATTARQALINITTHHRVVHVHANNFGHFDLVGGIPLPEMIEVTFLRKDMAPFEPATHTFPTPLDMPCNPHNADLYLGTFTFD